MHIYSAKVSRNRLRGDACAELELSFEKASPQFSRGILIRMYIPRMKWYIAIICGNFNINERSEQSGIYYYV